MADEEERVRRSVDIERKKPKKRFMTTERKKKLRLLVKNHAIKKLKEEHERKSAERRRIIDERSGKPRHVGETSEEAFKSYLKQYHERIGKLEEQKYDLEIEVRLKDIEISDLNGRVNDLRGKFIKPPLKRVSMYENRFAKLQKKAAEFNFRNQLKVVKKKEFTLEEEDKEPKKSEKAEWQKK